MTSPTFRSSLGPAIQELLALRKSLGYQDKVFSTHLASFDRYLVARGQRDSWLIRDAVDGWVNADPSLKGNSRARRCSALRALGRHIADRHPQTYIPGPTPVGASTFRPHIYTLDEIRGLLCEAARLTPVGSLRPCTFTTLIGLLFCTGLRVSEALALQLSDIDLDQGLLTIRHAKFHKTRALPLPSDVTQKLAAYALTRSRFHHRMDPEAHLFVNEWHRPCSYPTVNATFLEIARRVGIRGAPGQRGPRLHDLRHAFAVNRLLNWYRDGGDVQARLPLLSTYLGHVCLVSTQVYLDITAELLHEAARRFHPPVVLEASGAVR